MTGTTSRDRLLRGAAALALVATLGACAGNAGQPATGANLRYASNADPAAQAAPLLRYCEKMQEAGDLKLALGFCRRAIELDPSDLEAHLRLGEIANQGGAPREALAAYRGALTIDPNHAEARYGLAKAYLALGQPEGAREQLDQALLARPGDPRIANAAGVVRDIAGEHDQAQAIYAKALASVPGNHALRSNLGLSKVLQGEVVQGIEILEAVAKEPSAGAESRQVLAFAYVMAGEREKAAKLGMVDLPAAAVERNLLYLAALRAAQNAKSPPRDLARRATSGATQQEIEVRPVTEARGQAVAPVEISAAFTPSGRQVAALGESLAADLSSDVTEPSPSPAKGRRQATAAVEQARFTVQLGSYRQRESIDVHWQKLRVEAAGLLDGQAPMIDRADLGPERGVFYRLRSGRYAERVAAEDFCHSLKARAIDCYVVKLEG